MKKIAIASSLLLCFALLGSNAVAITVGDLPQVAVTFDDRPASPFTLKFNDDGKTFSDADMVLGESGVVLYSFTFDGNTDPFMNWSFTASAPGVYHVEFFIPISGGPYNHLTHHASASILDFGGGSNPSSITGTMIQAQVPAGTPITTLTGDASAPNGGIQPQTYGPANVSQNFGSPASMQEVLDFTFVNPDGDGFVIFGGQVVLSAVPTAVPEPASFILLSLGLVGIMALRRGMWNTPKSGR